MFFIEEVSKRFSDGTLAVDALSVTVCAGEIVCLLGGRGSGKSVALRLAAGLIPSTFGSIRVGEEQIHPGSVARKWVTYISTAMAHAPRLKPAENLRCYVALSGVWCGPDRCLQALREAGLPEPALNTATGALNAEHRLLIWLAAASLRNSPVLLIDDPSAGLEPGAVTRLQRWLARRRTAGTAVLLATSDPLLASQADRIVLLAEGRKVSEKTRDAFTAQTLLGLYLESLGHQ